VFLRSRFHGAQSYTHDRRTEQEGSQQPSQYDRGITSETRNRPRSHQIIPRRHGDGLGMDPRIDPHGPRSDGDAGLHRAPGRVSRLEVGQGSETGAQMMNWAEHESENTPQRATISPYWVLAAIILGIGLALGAGKVFGTPMFSATAENARITLTDEPCALWVEKDKTYEGCWGARQTSAWCSPTSTTAP
jgi:hypothetical protein